MMSCKIHGRTCSGDHADPAGHPVRPTPEFVRADLARMPRYQCHKVVHALKLSEVQHEANSTKLVFLERGFAPLWVSPGWAVKHNPQAGGYLVVYQDGYQSFSPAAAFEDGYTRLTD